MNDNVDVLSLWAQTSGSLWAAQNSCLNKMCSFYTLQFLDRFYNNNIVYVNLWCLIMLVGGFWYPVSCFGVVIQVWMLQCTCGPTNRYNIIPTAVFLWHGCCPGQCEAVKLSPQAEWEPSRCFTSKTELPTGGQLKSRAAAVTWAVRTMVRTTHQIHYRRSERQAECTVKINTT